jgi:hypothetical protein
MSGLGFGVFFGKLWAEIQCHLRRLWVGMHVAAGEREREGVLWMMRERDLICFFLFLFELVQ